MKNKISNQKYDEERSLYNIVDTEVSNCIFAGPADGESILKECRNILVENCSFSLRYPLWHAKLIIPDANHVDLYDNMEKIPFDKITEFYNTYLK